MRDIIMCEGLDGRGMGRVSAHPCGPCITCTGEVRMRHTYRQCRSDHTSADDSQDGVELLREVGNAPVERLIDEVLDAQELQGGVEVARLLKSFALVGANDADADQCRLQVRVLNEARLRAHAKRSIRIRT